MKGERLDMLHQGRRGAPTPEENARLALELKIQGMTGHKLFELGHPKEETGQKNSTTEETLQK